MPQARRKRRTFLLLVDSAEQQVAKLLTVITAVVIVAALTQLTIRVSLALIDTDSNSYWLGDGLIKILGDLLTVLIALEVLQNVTSYLRKHVIQIELVLVTALTAVARKVIVLPAGSENKPQLLIGLGIASIALAGSYWLVKRSTPLDSDSAARQDEWSLQANTERAIASQDADLSSPGGGDDGLESRADHPR